MFDFATVIDRHGTYSTQWDYAIDRFGSNDVLPFSISDTDFAVPSVIQEALQKRLSHPIYGYTRWNHEAFKQAICGWYARRYSTEIDPAWVVYAPSVVYGVARMLSLIAPVEGTLAQHSARQASANARTASVNARTASAGQASVNARTASAGQTSANARPCVALFLPYYDGLHNMLVARGYNIAYIQLTRSASGSYEVDWTALERAFAQPSCQAFVLTNPHNPTGKVFEVGELKRMAKLAAHHNVTILSDDIHQDLCLGTKEYTPLLSAAVTPILASGDDTTSSTCTNAMIFSSASKTFNIPGLGGAYGIIPDIELRERYLTCLKDQDALSSAPIFGMHALIAAYTCGDAYVDELRAYVRQNMARVEKTLAPTPLVFTPPEASYLAWIDATHLGVSDDELQQVLVQKAQVGIMAGGVYGQPGYLRMNVACPESKLAEGLARLLRGLALREQ